MAMGPRLEFRQSQTLVMTPQLLQAIKLLQLSTVELAAYVEAELERNPLLERVDGTSEVEDASAPLLAEAAAQPADWAGEELSTDRTSLERDLGTELENTFESDRPAETLTQSAADTGNSLIWEVSSSGGKSASFDDEGSNLEAYVASQTTLHEHLERQLGLAGLAQQDQRLGSLLIECIEDTGYLGEELEEISVRLGAPIEACERVLGVIQTFEPIGVGARDLAECLAIQLREKDRFDPAMEILVKNLKLLAKRDFVGLRRLARVDDEDLAEMIAELRHLDPKPGLIFGSRPAEAVTPDVFVTRASDGGWNIELNNDALPRVLANKSYYARISKAAKDTEGKTFVDEAWTSANWLTRSLEQRARTILKVSTEIVRQQDGFFLYGITHLRPLNLKTVADQVALHESTISRVTSNKFIATPRGIFEMKFFFTASIAATFGAQAHSAEAVRYRIKQLIDGETTESVLSDDALVEKLKIHGIDIARRTVAKYREAMRIPSSSVRRRERNSYHKSVPA
jgi:RNA polymerase sigma-54 factor